MTLLPAFLGRIPPVGATAAQAFDSALPEEFDPPAYRTSTSSTSWPCEADGAGEGAGVPCGVVGGGL